MAEKIILTGRKRQLKIKGSCSAQSVFARFRRARTNASVISQIGISSAGASPRSNGFFGATLSMQYFGGGQNQVQVSSSGFSGALSLNVPINPAEPDPVPDPPNDITDKGFIVNYGPTTTLTATVEFEGVANFVEIERIDTNIGSRLFEEVLDNTVASSFTATLKCNGQSVSGTQNVTGNDPTSSSRTNWDVTTGSFYAICNAQAQRREYQEFINSNPYYHSTPAYTITASASVSNECHGCDFEPERDAVRSTTGAFAGGGVITVTTPQDARFAVRADYQKRLHYPKTITRLVAKRRNLLGIDMPVPYSETGTSYFSYRDNSAGAYVVTGFDRSQTLDQRIAFAGGYIQATAAMAQISSGTVPANPGDIDTVNFPYQNNTPPAGTILTTNTGARPSGVLVNFTPGPGSGDPFQPAQPYSFWRYCSNSLSISGVSISQAALVNIAIYPFLSNALFGGAWSANNGGTVSEVSASRLRIQAAGSATKATLLFSADLNIGYRWLHARLQTAEAVAVTITVETGTTTGTVILMTTATLAAGVNDVWGDVLQTTRNIVATANTNIPESSILLYRRVTITVPAGKAVEVEYMRWERRTGSVLSQIPQFTSSSTSLAAMHGFTDGMPTKGLARDYTGLNSILTRFAARQATTGWAATYAGVVSQADTTKNDLPEASYLGGLEPIIDSGVNAPVIFRGNRQCHGVQAYYGAGDVLAGGTGAYGEVTPLRYDVYEGSQMTGTLIGDGAGTTLTTRKESDNATVATGTFAAEGFGVLAPIIPVGTTVTRTSASSDVTDLVIGGFGARQGTAFQWTPASSSVARAWAAYLVISGKYPLTIDSPRGLLHHGNGRRIMTYHLSVMQLAYQSIEHPSIDTWESLCFDLRTSTLYMVAKVAGQVQRRFYTSRDGGRNIKGGLTVDAKSSAVQRDSERNLSILLYQNSTDDVLKYQISRDGGTTWEAAANMVIDGAASTTGAIQSVDQDPRIGGALVATYRTTAGVVKVIRSRDSGKKWVTILP